MRIVGGLHRSRKLLTPKSDAVRPTSDKVRGALFNMLNSRCLLIDAIVIDAFCGTGALGLEALSQGAAHCTFIDNSKSSMAVCQENITILGLEAQSVCLLQDSTKLKPLEAVYDKANLVFLDPPYRKGLCERAIDKLCQGYWLAPECSFVIETAQDETINTQNLEIMVEKKYGDTKIILAALRAST